MSNIGYGNSGSNDTCSVHIEDKAEPIHTIKLFLWDITKYSKLCQFLSLTVCLLILYCGYGYLQELIFTVEGVKEHNWFVVLLQFGFYALFSWTELLLTSTERTKIPVRTIVFLGVLTIGSLGCTIASLKYVNYPTQVIMKSCKLIPVMIGGILIQNKRYSIMDFLAALLMCTGLCFFLLTDNQISPSFNIIGIGVLCFALICDAIIGNVQEKVLKHYNASSVEMIAYAYSVAFFMVLIAHILTGNLIPSIQFYMQNVFETFGYAAIFSASGYLGITCVLMLIKCSGVVAAVTVTTFRKAITMVISFLIFSKPFSLQYLWSGGMVFLGAYLHVLTKKKN